ncbi:MAG: hypothetical protein HRT41_15760 [Campylobacteraceae bacterium]|nr:hypothetical protein [Campylobacteraceae bacterium]
MRLEVEVFRFDYKMDYLPYYSKNYLKIKEEKTLLDILNTINEENPFAYENKEDFLLCINGIHSKINISIEDLIKTFGKDIRIEPISITRANKDLIIDEKDFLEKFDLIKKHTFMNILPSYMIKEFEKNYKTYKQYFYASNTLNIHTNYLGDAFLLLASDIIEKYKDEEKSILRLLTSIPFAASYHTALNARIHDFDNTIETRINTLQDKLKLLNKTAIKTSKKEIHFSNTINKSNIKFDFNDFNIFYYHGNNPKKESLELLNKLQATKLNLAQMKTDLALNTFNINKEFTYNLAARIVMDAFDNNADFVLVDDQRYFNLFDNNMKIFEKILQRDINMPVLFISELSLLASGEHQKAKESLSKHQIDLEII